MLARFAAYVWLILTALLPPVYAASANGLFAEGVAAFKKRNFASALQYFEHAKAAGLDTPAVHYNLGATLYKLGRYQKAENAFRDCARDPAWTALAYYNAGLAAHQRGQRAAAAEYFDRASRLADNREIQALALAMLERLDPDAARRATGAFAFSLGYNDNVTLAADSQTLRTSNRSDAFAELFASATGRWSADSNALRWDASLYDLTYTHLKEDSVTAFTLGAAQPMRLGPWHTEIAARWEYLLRDQQRFQQTTSIRIDGVRDWPDHRDMRLSLEISTIDALDSNFEFLGGWQQRLSASGSQPLGAARVRIGATLERNRRDDLATASEFFSFSPERASIWLKSSWPLGAYWHLEPTARYTQSRYADPDRRADGVVATREDSGRELVLCLRYRLTAAWKAVAEYSFVDNRSNFPEFSYSQRIASLGLARPF